MNLKNIESIIELFEQASIHKLTVDDDTMSITLTKGVVAPIESVSSAPVTLEAPVDVVDLPIVLSLKSMGVGFVKIKVNEGNTIKKGQIAFSITSMNIENDYKAEQDGVVAAIYVEDGVAVEFGQKLIDLNVG